MKTFMEQLFDDKTEDHCVNNLILMHKKLNNIVDEEQYKRYLLKIHALEQYIYRRFKRVIYYNEINCN
jgi:glycyl-tRNA synthetase beta subunit